MKTDLRVERRAVKVHFECPHCKLDIEWEYRDFCGDIGEPCDWKCSKFECPECEKEIEIDNIDWD